MNNDYQKWLNGNDCCCANNFIHIETSNCNRQDVCDCEHILLEISNLHTDDLVLQGEIDELSGDVANKLDASAYTPTDLSDYYTKEEVDALIPEVPSLSGYATEQWVEDKNYLTEHQPLKTINGQVISGAGNIEIEASGTSITVDSELSLISTNPVENKVITEALNAKLDASAYTPTDLSEYVTNSTLIQYVTNLQEQINSLISQISGCCGSSGETLYRWITETGENDYWCSGTTKYSMEKEQSSTDGINWTDTGSERSGSTVLEENCVECGYVPSYGMKLIATYNNGNTKIINCNGEWADTFIDGRDYRDYETGASGLTSAEIGSCPTTIAGYGFSGCTNLTAVTIPDNITSIGAWSFMGCIALSSVTIPSSVTYISQSAFIGCNSLSTVICNAVTPPHMGSNVFPNNSNLVIYVPAESVETYKTATGWSDYASIIQGM